MGFFGNLFGRKQPQKADSPILDFLNGEYTQMSSSNVAGAQYHAADRTLMIEFNNGSSYLYSPISEAMAASFANAGSKGSWVWDHLRVRGEGGDAKPAPGINVQRIR